MSPPFPFLCHEKQLVNAINSDWNNLPKFLFTDNAKKPMHKYTTPWF